ncbi:YiiX/YebB-like N1pC/P60 family cysteine hydrolase [Providencia rettgeri]
MKTTIESNNNQLPESGYVLNLDMLKTGDIILERGNSKYSPIISATTGGHYSHAMIYIEDTIIEATSDGGVFSRVPNRFFVKNKEDLIVLRYKDTIPKYAMDQLALIPRDLVGSDYSMPEAMKVPLYSKSGVSSEPSGKQFCSRLVAQTYNGIGIKLVDNYLYCSPNDFLRCKYLIQVENAVKSASREELEHASTGELHPKHVKCSVQWSREAKKIFCKNNITDVQSISDIVRTITSINNKKIDKLINTKLQESGYLSNYEDDREKNSYRYEIELFLEKYDLIENKDYFLENEVNKEKYLIKRYKMCLESYKTLHSLNSTKTVNSLINLYNNLLKIIQERLIIIIEAYESIDADTKHLNNAISYLQKVNTTLNK